MKFPVVNERLAVSTAIPAISDQYSNGVRLKSDASAVFTTLSAAGANASNGFLMNADGSIVTVDATAGLPAGVAWVNGIPVNSSGAVCTAVAAAACWSNGLPFAANGAISVPA